MPRRAVSLVELLVVIAIIAILAGLLIPVVNAVRRAARSAMSGTRCEEALRAITQVAHGDTTRTAAHLIHRQLQERLPALFPGVLDLRMDQGTLDWAVESGAWIPAPYAEHLFPEPWGRPPTDWADNPVSPYPATELCPAGLTLPLRPRRLGGLTPRASTEILALSGTLLADDAAGRAAYRSDRSPSRAWNDGWGRPLVAVLGLYQPPRNTQVRQREWVRTRGSTGWNQGWTLPVARDTLFLKRAQEAYGYVRSVYAAVGSSGPELPAGAEAVGEEQVRDPSADWEGEDGILVRLWRGIDRVANRDAAGDELWRTDPTTVPPRNPWSETPWSGVRRGQQGSRFCFLTAPVEIR